jgi:hypothetical protein
MAIGQAGAFDPKSARLVDVTLSCSSVGTIDKLNLLAVTKDGRVVDTSWNGSSESEGETVRLTGDVTAPEGSVMPQTASIAAVLAALDRVSIERLIAVAESTPAARLYTVHVLDDASNESHGLPASYPAYRWDGSQFVSLPSDDPAGRQPSTSNLFVVVFPMLPVAASSTTQADQTATTRAYESSSPTYFVIPL